MGKLFPLLLHALTGESRVSTNLLLPLHVAIPPHLCRDIKRPFDSLWRGNQVSRQCHSLWRGNRVSRQKHEATKLTFILSIYNMFNGSC